MTNIDELSLQLKLLSDDPIYVEKVPIQKVSFREIAKIGCTNYLRVINIFALDDDAIKEFNDDRIISAIGIFWLLAQLDKSFVNVFDVVCNSLFGSVPKSISYDHIVFPDFAIDENNIKEISNIVRQRNGVIVEVEDEEEDNPADARVAELLKRRKELRKQIAKKKREAMAESSDEDGITFVDLVSIFASAAKLPLSIVMEMDLYQLYNQFRRLQMWEQYETQVNALMHGAKSEEVNLKYYVRKLPNTNDVDDL